MVYGIMGTGRSLSIIRIAALSLCYAQQTILQLSLFWFACNRAKVMVLDTSSAEMMTFIVSSGVAGWIKISQ